MTRRGARGALWCAFRTTGTKRRSRPGRFYVALRDPQAERNGLLRIVDESGEDYLYERQRFAPLKLPRGVQQAFTAGG